MLVNNTVRVDSRVQKQARSIAESGWDVTLLGVSPDRQVYEGTLGDARVELRPLVVGLHQRPHEFRRAWLRDPLAYPPGPTAAWKRQWLQAQHAEVGAAKGAYAALHRERPLLPRTLRWAALQAKRTRLKVQSKWIGLRCRRSEALRLKRKNMDTRLDRLTTRFWLAVMGDRAWRRLDPDLWRYELAFGKAIDRIDPDVIHANDFPVLGVAARAKLRAKGRGRDAKLVWDAHEYLPGIRPWRLHPRWHQAQMAHEREYAPYADTVVTVSAALGEWLQRDFGLSEPPAVVLNAPMGVDGSAIDRDRELTLYGPTGERLWAPPPDEDGAPVPSLRERCGIGPEVPLMVYSGSDGLQRGLRTMVEALPAMPGVHAAFVVPDPENGRNPAILKDLGKELGVFDRLHFLPYVEYFQVVPHLSEADLGVVPIHHWPNHEIALITKFFEYSHARLPIVVSDVQAMSAAVRATGQGEVFTAEDTADFVRAASAVLTDPKRYTEAYDDGRADLDAWTWERQAVILDGVYRRVLGGPAR
jgi:glycosyltransferase involved in cell wall biosynthesis